MQKQQGSSEEATAAATASAAAAAAAAAAGALLPPPPPQVLEQLPLPLPPLLPARQQHYTRAHRDSLQRFGRAVEGGSGELCRLL
jgi:hypothetical protein